jgi:hypothetical protein
VNNVSNRSSTNGCRVPLINNNLVSLTLSSSSSFLQIADVDEDEDDEAEEVSDNE